MVGGFNTFLDEQKRVDGAARVTLVQFDSEDPFEVLIDGEDLATVSDLDPARYIPRGTTPLFDAVGKMIARIDHSILTRADAGLPIEDQVVLVVTDGFENASREYSGGMIADLIKARRERAWAFVFLGSDESTYAEGARMGVARYSTDKFDKSGPGTREMMRKFSSETVAYRGMEPERRLTKSEEYLEYLKAEEELRRAKSGEHVTGEEE
jgi:hypothetical protein